MVANVAAFADIATTPTGTVTITGLESGDTVTLYKIVGWDSTASDWAIDSELSIDGITTVNGLLPLDNEKAGKISAAALSAVTAAAADSEDTLVYAPAGSGSANSDGEFTATKEVGMYLALVQTSTANVYNPMFVSVNFTNPTTGEGGSVAADSALLGTGSTAIAKKQNVELEKEVDTAADGYSDVTTPADAKKAIKVGDTIPYVVTTNTPNYGANYTNPVFRLTDTLSDGLTLTEAQQAAITVYCGETPLDKKSGDEDTEYDYAVVPSESGYTITFSAAYLKSVKANTAITVKYTATVNAKAVMHQVERYTNDVDLVFSNSPTTEYDSLHDKTNHYTFSIDAYLTGESGGEGSRITRELVKVGVDQDGNVLTQWVTDNEESWTWGTGVQALQGATFTLTRSDGVVYNATSDENGYITFTGLDAASYTLNETSAPAGYKFDTRDIPVVISATYWGGREGQGTHADDELYSYSITVDGTATSTYTTTNDGGYTVTAQEVEENTNITFPINNVKGVTLPSTGGMGTTILYVGGSILVILAAILLITKRRMNAED